MTTIDTHGNIHNTKGQFAGRAHQEAPGGLNSLDVPGGPPATGRLVEDEAAPVRVETVDGGATRETFEDGSTKTSYPQGIVEYRDAAGRFHRADGSPAVVHSEGICEYWERGMFLRRGLWPPVELRNAAE